MNLFHGLRAQRPGLALKHHGSQGNGTGPPCPAECGLRFEIQFSLRLNHLAL